MEIKADKETLNNDLSKTIKELKLWKNSDRNKTNFISIYSGLVSALTTVLIGLASYIKDYDTVFQVIALLTSSSLTVVAAWDGLFKHKKLWIIQSSALNSFYELRNDIKHMEESNELSQEVLNDFYIQYKQIYSQLNVKWLNLREDS